MPIGLPSTDQLSQLISQATAPAFLLGAVAGFISILTTRMASVLDRIRSLDTRLASTMARVLSSSATFRG